MSERICVVHVGTHKTGTTSLQYFLQTNDAALARAGLHFAKTGWYGVVPGNHNVAWELVRGERGPNIGGIFAELGAVETSSILSSEEFSLLHDRPEALTILAEGIRASGARPRALLYLRAQAEFLESLFVEQIKHGAVRPLGALIDEVIRTGIYRLPESNVAVEYGAIERAFVGAFGPEDIVVRPYARSADTMVIFYDFMSALARLIPGFDPSSLGLELAHPRINESLTFGALLGYTFVHLRPDIGLPDDAGQFFAEHVPDVPRSLLDERYALLTRDEHLRFIERFADDNRALEERYGIRIAGTRMEELAPIDDPRWERARFERAVFDRCVAAWSA